MASFLALKGWRSDVAVDLGTAFTRVAARDRELFKIPSVCRSGPVLRCGTVADPFGAAEILRPLFSKRKRLGFLCPRAVASAPSDATAEELETLVASLIEAGAASVHLVPAPLAAALGAGIDVSLPYAQMIVDVGAGVTDCAVFRSGEMVRSRTTRIGCGTLRNTGIDPAHQSGGAEMTIGNLQALAAAGARGSLKLPDADSHAVLRLKLIEILGTAETLLQESGDRVGCEVIESGIVLTGGGALFPGMRESLAACTSIHIITPSCPLDAVVLGLRAMLD